jgi:hypothetical protein
LGGIASFDNRALKVLGGIASFGIRALKVQGRILDFRNIRPKIETKTAYFGIYVK